MRPASQLSILRCGIEGRDEPIQQLVPPPGLDDLGRHALPSGVAAVPERQPIAAPARLGELAGSGGQEVSRLGPGGHFGEVALISDRIRTATVTALTDLHTYVMTVWDFRSFVQGDAEVAWKLLEQLAEMLHRQPSHSH